jgi:hypothetical protein
LGKQDVRRSSETFKREIIIDKKWGIEYYSSTKMKRQTTSIQAYYYYYYTRGELCL